MEHERELMRSGTMEQQIGGMMGGIRNLSEMEAIINFKEKEIEEVRADAESRLQEYKRQKAQLKEELEVQKEQVLRLQQGNIERDLYKSQVEEFPKVKARLQEVEASLQ